jgi:hypothetical protein
MNGTDPLMELSDPHQPLTNVKSSRLREPHTAATSYSSPKRCVEVSMRQYPVSKTVSKPENGVLLGRTGQTNQSLPHDID